MIPDAVGFLGQGAAMFDDSRSEEVEAGETTGNNLQDRVELPWRETPDFMQILVTSKDRTDPEALRESGARIVASKLVALAEWARFHPDHQTRALARLVEIYFAEDNFREGKSFDVFIGIRPDGGRPSLAREAAIFERNKLLREAARMQPWVGMAPTQAARAMRGAFDAYEVRAWPRERKLDEPPRPNDAVRTIFWKISKTGAPGPMPSRQGLADHIRAAQMTPK